MNNKIEIRSDSPQSDPAAQQPKALQISIPTQDQQLLTTFPRPPSRLTAVPTPTRSIATPTPSPRPSDFGFIDVGLSPEVQNIVESIDHTIASFVPGPQSILALNPGELQLVLDNPLKLYAPGDTITGYVSGWDSSEPLTHIHIILSGTAKTYMHTEATQHQDYAALLYQETHLQSSDQGLVPRFAISIPDECATDVPDLNPFAPAGKQYWTTAWLANAAYEHQPGHPLPPSMRLPSRTSHKLSSRIAARGYVEYKLVAVRSSLNPFTGKLVPEASFQALIRLTTRHLLASTTKDLIRQTASASKTLHVQTTQLRKERRLSLCERTKDAFNPTTPDFYFSATVTTPRVAVSGADIKLSVSISVLPPPAGKIYNFPVPDVRLKRFDARIRSYQGLRVLMPAKHNPTKSHMESHTFKTLELRTVKEPPDSTFRPREGNFDSQCCLIYIALPSDILPSFKTFNLWRAYRLEVDVTFCVAGKRVSVSVQSDLNIIARPAGSRQSNVKEKEVRMEEEDKAESLEIAEEMVRRAIV
jgi:hypothetical protein